MSGRSSARSARRERAIELALFACALASLLTSCAILWVFAGHSRALFADLSFASWLFEASWSHAGVSGSGFAALLLGTALTTAIACLVAVPLGVLGAIYLSEFAEPRIRRTLEPGLELLARVPTVVLAYFALSVVSPSLARVIPGLDDHNALSAGLVLGLMILPMVVALSQAALARVPRSLREAAWGLGAGELRTIFRVVLPAARSGIAAGVLLALSRALGETMIVTLVAGSSPSASLDPRAATQTLSAEIVELALTDAPAESPAFQAMFAIGAGLLVISLLTNLVAQSLRRREGRAPPQ